MKKKLKAPRRRRKPSKLVLMHRLVVAYKEVEALPLPIYEKEKVLQKLALNLADFLKDTI